MKILTSILAESTVNTYSVEFAAVALLALAGAIFAALRRMK